MQGEDGARFGVARGDVLAVGGDDAGQLGFVDLPVFQGLEDHRVDLAALDRRTHGAGQQVDVVRVSQVGHGYEYAVVEAGEVVGQIAGAGDFLQLAHLFVRQRAVAGVLVQLVVELLEIQPQAGSSAFAAPGEGGNHGQYGAAAAIKNRALHLLVSLIGRAHYCATVPYLMPSKTAAR